MSEVGALIVRLQAETAQFREDMGKVKGDLTDLKGTSERTGEGMKMSMHEARGGLMLVEDAVGVRLPRHLNSLIAEIPGVGAAFSAMLPIAGVAVAIKIIMELIEKHKLAAEAARELGNAQSEAASKGATAFESLGDKLLQAGIKADTLAGHHLAALNKQLELLDHQELKDLMDTFEKFGAEADKIFAKVKAGNSFWQIWKSGSDGAKAAVGDFKAEYDALLAKGDSGGAADLLKGTLASAVKLQQAQETYNDLFGKQLHTAQEAKALHEAVQLMHDDDLKADKSGLAVQQAVVQALQDQVQATAILNATKAQEAKNTKAEDVKKDVKKEKPESEFMKVTLREAEHTLAENERLSDALKQTWDELNRADEQSAKRREQIDKAAAEAEADAAMRGAIETAQLTQRAAEQYAIDQDARHKKTAAQTLQAIITASQAETSAEVSAYQTRLKNLDKFDKDYLKKVTELQKQIDAVTKRGESDVTDLKATAAQKQALEIQNSENRMREAVASNIASSIVMNKNLAASFRQTGAEMAEQMIKNLIMMELTGDKEKLIHAKSAYHKAFDAMSGIPPAPMWGYAAGAAAFASVMSFETGGKIPGASVGSAGAVPIIGHQGETVVTKALTDRVESSERTRGSNGGAMPAITFAPQIHAVDANGVDSMLAKHASVFQRHISAALRRMNK